MALLRYQHPAKGTVWVELEREAVVIGRGADCDLVIDDNMSSRRHAEVRKQPGGGHILVDLNSKNGTFVNGTPVSKWGLKDGDLISIGSSSIAYKLQR